MSSNNESLHPVLSLGFQQPHGNLGGTLQLNLPDLDGYIKLHITSLENKQKLPVTLLSPGLNKEGKLDIAASLCAGLMELIEQDTQKVVIFPRGAEEPVVGNLPVNPSCTSPHGRHYQTNTPITYNSTAPIWKDTVQPGKTYILRFTPPATNYNDTDKIWCRFQDAPANQKLPVRLERSTSSLRFTVLADPPPPRFSAIFRVIPTSVCHLSPSGGYHPSVPFKFVAEITSDADEPVTVCTQRNPFGRTLPIGNGLSCLDEVLYCVDVATGEEVEFPASFQCFDSDPWGAFPADTDFVEVRPGEAWRWEYQIDDQHEFEGGHRYEVQLSNWAKKGFGMWMFGRREDLLRGTLEEKMERWKYASAHGRISVLQVNDPVTFDVVVD
ncbi:hypothetical protein DBV05_g10138 [Lasiodiplodia theobromae]|uniref:Uncharacterized protein n=1 Tax=Lasiodiplodia theobromae TaxID=45133 RepID=A0A5N5D0R5_9PEZI|nr:hypothetical protein DBV05_g10138 [Lasiodiplodia theobromae]